jgi:hypothetical protein
MRSMGAPARSDFRPVDTTADADAVQLETYRQLSGTERVAIAFRLTALVRETASAGIRRRHPDYDEDKVRAALARLTLGDTLVRQAFPGRDLVDP